LLLLLLLLLREKSMQGCGEASVFVASSIVMKSDEI